MAANRVRELELDVARLTARAEAAERLLETVLRAAFPGGVAPTLVPAVPTVPAEPSAVTPVPERVRAVCEQFAPNGDRRQYAINLREARRLLAKGESEETVIRHLYRGERVSA